jgi:hypothetical protein
MTIKNRKKSSKTLFLLYAVIWGLFFPVLTGKAAAPVAEELPVPIEETIRSLEDPFDVQARAPQLIKFFLKGLEEIKEQLKLKEKPVEESKVEPVTAQPVTAPKPVIKSPEPPKVKKLDIPEMKLTGIIYDTPQPQAIINGKVVEVGSVVDGVSILKIQKGRVEARYEGSDIVLKLNKE